MPVFVKYESPIPFAVSIYSWLQVDRTTLDLLAHHSRLFERSYLAWETVRKTRNPFFDKGTGFEGYFIGVCRSPEETLERILALSRAMLQNICRMHPRDWRFRSRLMHTLVGEQYDARALAEWSAQFGAALARLRPNLRRNPLATAFQMDTYRQVGGLPHITYQEQDAIIEQVYVLAQYHLNGFIRMPVDSATLPESDQEAWLIARRIGLFGHPLVRQYLRQSRI